MSAVVVGVGAEVRWEGTDWTVVAFHEHGMITLRSVIGEVAATDLVGLVGDPTFSCAARDRGRLDDASTFDALPAAVRRTATERLEHLREARTGYRSGQPADALAGEPRADYDPARALLTVRMQRKANEIGVSRDTLYDWWKRVNDPAGNGLLELVDRRGMRQPLNVDRVDSRVRDAIETVLLELSKESASKIGHAEKRRRVRRLLRTRHPDVDIAVGSDSTLDRHIALIAQLPGRRSAKRRPNQRSSVRAPYGRLHTTRPGEVVLLDSTKLNFMVLDPVTLKPKRAWLTTALDHFTRCILAGRVTCDAIAAEEATQLLADMVRPRAWLSHWPERARWRYHGIPETIVATMREEWRITDLSAKPPVVAEMCVVDGAWATKSHAFWAACRHIGSDLQLARPYTPTDKAHKERFYGTINRWQEAMPGFIGRNATERGVNVEQDACYLPHEAEDLFWQYVLGIYHCTEHDGLVLPDAPKHPVSPNRMYDIGVATSGMVRLPADPDIYYELLPVKWRAIPEGPITIDGVPYDDVLLKKLRGIASPYKDVKPNVWPFRIDRRDPSQVYVKIPDDGWRSIAASTPGTRQVPFGRTATDAARRLPTLDEDPGFISRRDAGVHADAWLDTEQDRRAKRLRIPPSERADRALAAAADRDATTLKQREPTTTRPAKTRKATDGDLGDFAPTIYDVGSNQ